MAVLFLVLLSHKTKAAEAINKVDKEYKNGELILRHVSEIPHILESVVVVIITTTRVILHFQVVIH